MTEAHAATVSFLREQHHATLADRLATLRRDLDDEMAARARAEANADDARDLADDLRDRLRHAEAANASLRWVLRSRLLPWAVYGVSAGLGCGLAGGALLLAGGWW